MKKNYCRPSTPTTSHPILKQDVLLAIKTGVILWIDFSSSDFLLDYDNINEAPA